MTILSAQELQKSYGPAVVLRSATLSIDVGERVGIVGRNGAGKSTFARILAGIEGSDGGQVAYRRGATVLYLDQAPTFDAGQTAISAVTEGLGAWKTAVARSEEIGAALRSGRGDLEALLSEQANLADEVERLGGWDQEHRISAMLGHLGIARPEAEIGSMSGGEQRRVALARILVAQPDLAILDEPTNHLDTATVEWLEQYLVDEFRGAILLITHDRYLLDRVATRTIEIAEGEIHSYDGGYELYLEQKAERLAHAERSEKNRQNFLRRELEWLRRGPKARTTKQKARIQRAEAAQAVRAPKAESSPTFALEVRDTGKTILELHGLALEVPGRVLFSGLDLFVTKGERIGIVGANGTGKSTLLKAILGRTTPREGAIVVGQNTKIAYFDQERGGLDDRASVYDNVVGEEPKIELGGTAIDPRTYLERFGFDAHRQRQVVSSLSGGERARVALARMLRQSANLVILDEPTNDLDVETLAAVEDMLVESQVTALVVTHDRFFLDRIATSILAFEGDGRVVRYPGNYTTYRSLRPRNVPEGASEKANVTTPPAESKAPSRPKKKLSYAEARELEALPGIIDEADAHVRSLTERLADPATYVDGGSRVPALHAELEKAKAELERLMLRWEELEAKTQSDHAAN